MEDCQRDCHASISRGVTLFVRDKVQAASQPRQYHKCAVFRLLNPYPLKLQ